MTPVHWRYKLLGKLGRGATSVVYQALDLATGDEVALKAVPAEQAEGLRQEYRRLHRLSHPGLVRAFDLHRTEKHALLSLELLETTGLILCPEDEESWISFWSQLASVLRHLHSRGLVHADIKPENIGRSGGLTKLIDLGLSGKSSAGYGKGFSGTPAYAPPEMLEQGISSPAGDVYSLGLVLWEGAGGALPSPGQKLDPSEAWLGTMPEKMPDRAAEIVRGMLRHRRLDRIADGGQLAWAMAEAGLYREAGPQPEMPLAGRAAELRRAMKAVRKGAKKIRIQARPGTGATRFLDELKRLLQLEGYEVCPAFPAKRLPTEAPSECWLLHDAGENGSMLSDNIYQGLSISAPPRAFDSNPPLVELSDLDRGGYLRILQGMFRGSSAADLEGLAGWLEGQAGGHLATARALLGDVMASGFIRWGKHRWKLDWQGILGVDAARAVAGRWEERWGRLDDGSKRLLKQTALAGLLSPAPEDESDFAKLDEWLRLEQGLYRFVGQAVRGLVLEKCSAEECGQVQNGGFTDGKGESTQVLGALARAEKWEAWREKALNIFRQAQASGDGESTIFYGRMLAGSGRLGANETAEVLAGTAMACRALGRFRLGLDFISKYGGDPASDWSLCRAGMVLAIGAGDLKRARELVRVATGIWNDERAIRMEAQLFLGLIEGMSGGRDKGEAVIAAIQSQAAAMGLTGLQRLAFQFRATLAHLAGDWDSVIEHAEEGLKLNIINKTTANDIVALVIMLSNALVRTNRTAEAEEKLSEFMEIFQKQIDTSELRTLNAYRGMANIKLGNWELAYKCLINAERLSGDEENPNFQGFIATNLSLVLGARSQHRSEAEKHLEAYHLYREAGDTGNAIISLGNYGVKKKFLGETAESFSLLQECLKAAREKGLESVRLLAAKNLGLAEFEERHWEQALKLFRESRQSAEAAGQRPNFEAELFAALSLVLTGEAAGAREALNLAKALAQNPRQEIWIEYAEGMIMEREGGEGLPKIVEAVSRMREQGRSRDAALMALTAAESAGDQAAGDPMCLLPALLEAEAEFGRLGDRGMQDRARQAIVNAARELAAAPGSTAGQGMLEAFYQLAFLLKSGAGPGQVGQAALEQAVKLTEAERGGLFLVGEDGRPELLSGVNLDQSTIRDAYEFSARALGQAGREGAEVVSNDAQADDELSLRDSVKRNAIRSLACMPLQFREGAGGALYLDSRLRPGIFSSGRRQFLRALAAVVGAVLESSRLMENLRADREQTSELDRIIGSSPPVTEMKLRIRKAAGARVNVLIEGETGTGKELAARAIHSLSDRRAKPFVALDCGSLPETLLEAELFGHIKGAFTGAHADKPGLFEAADGGTMFLDEITSASPAVQARLLRVIEEGEIRRVGDTRVRKVDVRLICAANKDMEFEMGEGRFKPDLYYRLNEFRIAIPPLRDRGRDILALAEHLLRKHQRLQGKRGLVFSPGAKKAMASYPWPGNIREMENAVQKAVLMAGQEAITEQDLELPVVNGVELKAPANIRNDINRATLVDLLRECGNNTAMVAGKLGISRRQVQRLIKKNRIAT